MLVLLVSAKVVTLADANIYIYMEVNKKTQVVKYAKYTDRLDEKNKGVYTDWVTDI